MDLKTLYCYLIIGSTFDLISGSLYDPHMFPGQDKGPFFEGWYMRITDQFSRNSFGLLFGSVLPSSARNISGPLVVASLLLRRCDITLDTCTLTSIDGKFTTKDLDIKVNGQAVTSDPDKASPPNFKWQVDNGSHGGFFEQKGGKTTFNFRLGDLTLRGEAKDPYLWNEAGTGPEGWLVNLPLPLHWFVFSLRSDLSFYEIQNITSGTVTKGNAGAVHLEKNWGKSFPSEWIWSEGISFDPDNATFALSGGLVDFSIISVHAYLIGYRNQAQNLSLDFRPDNSVISAQINGCAGNVNVSVNSLMYKMEISLIAPVSTFSSCLLGPETRGFLHACVESYDAEATIRVSKRSFLLFQYNVVEEKTFRNIALEFGGHNVCKDKCGKPGK